MLARIIRLYPLYLFGVALGAITVMLGSGALPDQTSSRAAYVSHTLSPLLMMPDIFAPLALYPLNAPAWSLFFELLINVAFAATLFFMRTSRLIGKRGLRAALPVQP